MRYLDKIKLPDGDKECDFLRTLVRTCFSSHYPFGVLSSKQLSLVEFSDITIFCGSNGSGKSTLLNIIANKLDLNRSAPFNQSTYYDDYLKLCRISVGLDEYGNKYKPKDFGQIITSDDIFKYMIELRNKNQNADKKRWDMLTEIHSIKHDPLLPPPPVDFENKESVKAYCFYADAKNKNKSASGIVRKTMGMNNNELSNGETALKFFDDTIQPDGLYLLDEPENSLSSENQELVAKMIAGMARFYNCQFVISSHSPFFLSIGNAKIYDLDSYPVKVTRWTDIPNIRILHDFFKEQEQEF
jgi:predicted ATPase